MHNTTSMYIQPHRGPSRGTMEHSACFKTDFPTTMRPDNANGGKRRRIVHMAMARHSLCNIALYHLNGAPMEPPWKICMRMCI